MEYVTTLLPQKCFREMANDIINLDHGHRLRESVLA
jgi:hypothetical protein